MRLCLCSVKLSANERELQDVCNDYVTMNLSQGPGTRVHAKPPLSTFSLQPFSAPCHHLNTELEYFQNVHFHPTTHGPSPRRRRRPPQRLRLFRRLFPRIRSPSPITNLPHLLQCWINKFTRRASQNRDTYPISPNNSHSIRTRRDGRSWPTTPDFRER